MTLLCSECSFCAGLSSAECFNNTITPLLSLLAIAVSGWAAWKFLDSLSLTRKQNEIQIGNNQFELSTTMFNELKENMSQKIRSYNDGILTIEEEDYIDYSKYFFKDRNMIMATVGFRQYINQGDYNLKFDGDTLLESMFRNYAKKIKTIVYWHERVLELCSFIDKSCMDDNRKKYLYRKIIRELLFVYLHIMGKSNFRAETNPIIALKYTNDIAIMYTARIASEAKHPIGHFKDTEYTFVSLFKETGYELLYEYLDKKGILNLMHVDVEKILEEQTAK